MPRVFISYRRGDSEAVVGRLYDRLVDTFGRRQVFRDVSSIDPGEDFRTVIEREIAKCDVVLVLIGPQWIKGPRSGDHTADPPESDHVFMELERALAGRALVVPILVGDASFPADGLVPKPLHRLRTLNARRLRPDPDFHRDVTGLLDDLQVDLQTRLPPHEESAPALVCPGVVPGHRVRGSAWSDRCGAPLALPLLNPKCPSCGTRWSSRGAVHRLVVDDRIRPHDARSVQGHQALAFCWNLLVKVVDANRRRMVEDLRLQELRWQAVGRPPRILEVGCATGENLGLLGEELSGEPCAELWAADLSPRMAQQALRRRREVVPHSLTAIEADVHRLPFPDSYFDRVVSTGCEFAHWQTAMGEMLRVCRPGGILFVASISPTRVSSVFQAAAQQLHRILTAPRPSEIGPRDCVPPYCVTLRDEQMNELFWVLTVRA